MFKNQSNLLRIVILALILVIIIVKGVVFCCEKQSRYNALVEAGSYELYFTYIARDSDYRLFLLLYDPPANPDQLKSRAASIIEEENLITDLHSRETYREFGDHPIRIYFLQPNEEIPYGWEKSELNISMNFDQSAFYRAAVLTAEIPADALTAGDCIYELYEH